MQSLSSVRGAGRSRLLTLAAGLSRGSAAGRALGPGAGGGTARSLPAAPPPLSVPAWAEPLGFFQPWRGNQSIKRTPAPVPSPQSSLAARRCGGAEESPRQPWQSDACSTSSPAVRSGWQPPGTSGGTSLSPLHTHQRPFGPSCVFWGRGLDQGWAGVYSAGNGAVAEGRNLGCPPRHRCSKLLLCCLRGGGATPDPWAPRARPRVFSWKRHLGSSGPTVRRGAQGVTKG